MIYHFISLFAKYKTKFISLVSSISAEEKLNVRMLKRV